MNKVTLSVAALAAIGGTVQVQAAEQTVLEKNAEIKAALTPVIEAAINEVDTKYPDVKVTYHERLSALMNELVKAAESETKLIVESYYTNAVNDIKNAAKSAQEPYTLQNELLNDVTSDDIYSIKELQSYFDTKYATVTLANYPNAYASIKAKMDAQKTAIDNLKARIEGYDLSTRDIITDKGDLVRSIGIINSSIGSIMKNAPLEEANLDKYTLIAKRIETAKADYNQKLQDAIKLLPSGENGEYGDWQKKAINELNEQYRVIVAVEKSNGTDENHENAAANYADNDAKLTAAEGEIANILDKYTTNKATEEDAKTEADEMYNDVNTQYTNLNALLTKCEVASKWATQLTEISTALSTMKNNITTHYSNGHNDLSSFGYAAAKTAIADKIDNLTSDSQPDVDNWKAWDRVNTKINTLRTSKNNAVKAATDAVSTDKQYNAAAHMTKFAEAIEGAISALEILNNTAKAGGTAVENENSYDDSAIKTNITNYGTYATAALSSYNTAQDKIAKAETGLATLKEAVGEDVLTTVDAVVGGKTYKATIEGIEVEIKAIKDQVTLANNTDEKTGVQHKTEMGKAAGKTVYNQTVADNIKLAIEGLATQYTTNDKQQFEKNNKVAAADKIVKDATTLVNSLTASLDKAVYGDGVETVYTEDDLGNQKDALVGTEGVITKLRAAINAATTKDGVDLIPSDWDTKSNDDKYSEAEGVITSLTQVIETLNGLTTEVEAAAQKADEARDNYSRYKTTYPKTAPSTDATPSATAQLIASTMTTVSAYETSYYTTLLSGYVTDLAQLRNDVQKAYDELKMAKLQETLEISISELYDNVAAVEAAAKANEDAHDAQVAKVTGKDGLQDAWNAAYKYISENDESTIAKDYLAELGPLQEAITNLSKNIQTSYDRGKSVENGKATIDAEIERITTSIADIRARQEAGYVQAIQNDNDDQHKQFTDATAPGGYYESAVKAYNDAVDVLTQFSKIQNKALQEAIKDENLVQAHDDIYAYANKLRDLFSRESNKYTTTVSPVVYSSEDFCIEATNFKNEINDKLALYQQTVNAEALKLYQKNIQDAVDALDAAKLVVGAWDNYKKDPASAFADIAQDINDASVAANISGTGSVDPMFAVKIDNWLDILDATKLSQKIEADKLAAAKNEFKLQYNKVVTLYTSEVATIKTYTSIDTSTYLTDLATKKAAVDNANTDWGKVKDANKVSECTTYVNKVKAYYDARVGDAYDNEHSAEYNDATAASVASEANIAAYQEMIGKMNKAEISINEVLDYIDALFVTHKKGSAVEQEIDRIVAEYEDMLDQIETWYLAGECADNFEYTFRNYVNPKLPGSLPQSLDLLKAKAINDEVPALKTEIDRVKEEYNKAVEKNGLQDEEIAKKEAAIAALYKTLVGPDAANATDAEKCIQTRLNEGLLEGDAAIEELVALHSEIASLSKSLTDTYDAEAYANAVAEVKAQSEALNAVVADIVTRAAEFDDVNEAYGEDITAAKNALAAIDFDFEKMNADSQILFYKNNLLNQYDRLNSDINSWKAGFNTMHAKYTVNKQVYESLAADLASYKAELERVNGEVADFKNNVTEWGTIDGVNYKTYNSRYLRSTNISTAIKNAETELNTAYTNVTLENGDKGKYNSISKNIVAYERKAKYDEVNSYDIPVLLANAISDVDDYVNEVNPLTGKKVNNYSSATAKYLSNSISNLNDNKNFAGTYNNDSFNSDEIWYDLDGTYVGDAGQACPYLSADGWTAVRARVQSLISQAESLLKEAKDKAYTQGDADHNRKVNVNDYSVVRNWILTAKNFEDIEEAKAYGGDVNGDKKFDVADLTCISNIIFNIDYELPEPAKSAVRAKVVDTENSLSVVNESEETTIFGKTVRLAVNISNAATFTAGQMDITLPQGMKLAGQSLSDRANGHELLANEISGGKYRLVASTVENNEFLGNGGALIYLDVEVSSDFAGGSISVDNAIFTDAKANSYYLTANGPIVPTGIDGIEAATVKERIYSVGGQMMKAVKKGLNIIVGDDNKAKKVVK